MKRILWKHLIDVWQTDKCDIRIKNISTVWAWKVTWRGFKCAEKDRKFEIGRILDLDWKALRWEFISTLTQKRKCDITQRTEKETREQEAFSWRRSGYLGPNWYINRTHRHVCRIEDLETVNLYTSPFCAKKAHLIVIGLPCIRVEIFRTRTYSIVEGYGSVHLRDSKRWEDRKEWAPRGSAWQRVPRFLLQSLSCALPPGGSRTGRALVDLQGKRG